MDSKKRIVRIKITKDEEGEILADFLRKTKPEIKEETVEEYLGFARSTALIWEGGTLEVQRKKFLQLRNLGIGEVTADPPVEAEVLDQPSSEEEPAEKPKKLKIVVKIKEGQQEAFENILRSFLNLAEEDIVKRTEYALLEEGAFFFFTEEKERLALRNAFSQRGFEILEPLVTKVDPEELKPEDKKSELDEINEAGGPQVVDDDEMAEIVLTGYGKYLSAGRALSYVLKDDDKVENILLSLTSREKQIISVPKFQKDEVREKLAAAGLVLEVEPDEPEPVVEPETEIEASSGEIAKAISAGVDKFLEELGDGFNDLEEQIQATKPEPVDLTPVLTAIKEIKIPEPTDLTSVQNQISETGTEVVEEIRFVLIGGTDADGNEIEGLADRIAGRVSSGFAGMALLTKRVKSARMWAIGTVIVVLICASLILGAVVSKPAPVAKVDFKSQEFITAVQGAAKAAVIDLELKVVPDTDAVATAILEKMKAQGLVAKPAGTTQNKTETGTTETPAVSGKRTGGKH